MLKKIIFLFSLTALMLLTGCASTGLVHDKIYLRAVSINRDTETELTLSFFNDDEKTITASGSDIKAALKNAEIKSGKPIVTGYTELIILEKCDYGKTLEFLLNDLKVSPSCIISYSTNGSKTLKDSSAEKLKGSIKRANEQGKVHECSIITVMGDLFSDKGRAEIAEISDKGYVGNHLIYAHKN